jgi:hypothetical protein
MREVYRYVKSNEPQVVPVPRTLNRVGVLPVKDVFQR